MDDWYANSSESEVFNMADPQPDTQSFEDAAGGVQMTPGPRGA
ncbi:MAG: hypothetical protein R3E52_07060 [Burkholderiaceae bacterium]